MDKDEIPKGKCIKCGQVTVAQEKMVKKSGFIKVFCCGNCRQKEIESRRPLAESE